MTHAHYIAELERLYTPAPDQDEIAAEIATTMAENPLHFQNTILSWFYGPGICGFVSILYEIAAFYPATLAKLIEYCKHNNELLTFFGRTNDYGANECFEKGFWGFRNYHKSFKLAFHWNPLGHYCLYIAVPPRHTLFGKSYDRVPNATFSGFIPQIPGDWWAFGFDFGQRYDMTIPNIINRHLPPMVETPNIDDLDILTVAKLNDIIESFVYYLREIHKKNTGFEYSAWNHGNKRQRQRWARRAEQVRNQTSTSL
jgi:hypothetical protein